MNSDTKEPDEVVEKKPKKNWTEKLNIKVKNNFSQYITIEPLLCIFLIRYLIFTLQEPYNLAKKCEKLDGDQYLCEDVASLSYLEKEDPIKWEIFKRNQSLKSADRAWNDPEDYRKYDMFITATKLLKLQTSDYTITLYFAYMVQFLIVLLLSNYSDKFSKRKLCLWIPLLGQLLVSIVNIIGAVMFNLISYDYVRLSVIAIESLTGGQELLLFGCFCYMSRAEMKRNIYIGFGIIGLVVTVIRNVPLNYLVHESNKTGDAYIFAIIFYFFYIVFCLGYVKIILNELKREQTELEILTELSELSGDGDGTKHDDDGSTTISKKKTSKSAILAKAFFLDVISDYVKLVLKDRKHKRRWIIILYLMITFVSSLWPYNKECFSATFRFSSLEKDMKIDDYDFQGVMLVAIPILVIYIKITDLTVAIIATIGPHIANLVFKSFQLTDIYTLDVIHDNDGMYDRFIGLLICAVLLVLVDNTEIRIYLVFKVVSFGATYIDTLLYVDGKKSKDYTENFIIQAYVALIILSLGFWLLVILMKKSEALIAEELSAKKLAARSNRWKFVIAAQRLKSVASTSSHPQQTDPLNGQQIDPSHSSNGDNVETSNL